MRSLILALTTLASLAVASPAPPPALIPPPAPPAIHQRAASCASPQTIQFHYNDTSIGSTSSCTADVMDRGTSAPVRRATLTEAREFTARELRCADGPNITYVIKSDDSLEKIAALYSSGVCNIAALNGLTRNPDFIVAGNTLIVPTNVCPENVDNTTCRKPGGTGTCVVDANGDGVEARHIIVSGDTFTKVANDLGITVPSLVAANPGVEATNLQLGQVINVPICK